MSDGSAQAGSPGCLDRGSRDTRAVFRWFFRAAIGHRYGRVMTRPTRMLVPLFGATVVLAIGGAAPTALAAQPTETPPATGDPAATTPVEPTEPVAPATEEPEATTSDGSEVAGAQVEGEASVSTESGFSGSTSGSGDGLKGTFGLGAIRTLGGLTGINARYFVMDRLSVGLNVGVGTWTYHENRPGTTDMCPGPDCDFEDTRTVATLGLGLEALYFVKLGNPAGTLPFRADFGVGGRFTYFQGINATDVQDNHDDPTEFDIEIPMVVQLRFGDHFTLSPEFGLNFIVVPGERAAGDVNPGTFKPDLVLAPNLAGGPYSGPGFGFQITNGVGVFGGASLHYYF